MDWSHFRTYVLPDSGTYPDKWTLERKIIPSLLHSYFPFSLLPLFLFICSLLFLLFFLSNPLCSTRKYRNRMYKKKEKRKIFSSFKLYTCHAEEHFTLFKIASLCVSSQMQLSKSTQLIAFTFGN